MASLQSFKVKGTTYHRLVTCRRINGKPTPVVLAYLGNGQGLDQVVFVVTRYFGGIKLGAGGLVRAYSGAAAQCLRLAPKVEVRPRVTLRLEVPFALTGEVYPVIESRGAVKLK